MLDFTNITTDNNTFRKSILYGSKGEKLIETYIENTFTYNKNDENNN